MSNHAVTYLVAVCGGVFSLAAYVAWIAIPAWSAYTRTWERLAAVFLTLYVLAAMLVVGVLGGALFAYYWDVIGA